MFSAKSANSVGCRRKLAALGFAGLILGAPLWAAEELTLQASLERASKNNPRLLLANKDVAVAKTQLRQAKSLYYPKVNLNLDYARYRNETLGVTSPELGGMVLEAPIQDSRDDSRGNPLAQNLYLGRINFVQTLYAGGKVSTTHRLSQVGVHHAENAYETVRHEVECETALHFYRLLALREEEKILSNALIDIERLAKVYSGAHSTLALSAAQSGTRQRLSNMKQEIQAVRFSYLRAMGIELFSDVEVKGSLDAAQSLPELQTVLAWAKQNRAELKETQIQEEVDQLSVELSRSERYPVFLLGGAMEVRNDEFPLEDTNWNTVLSMNIPIFDGFSSLARIKESRYRADQGRLRRVQLEDQIELEVRSAHGEWFHWKNEVDARRQQMTLLEDLQRKAKQQDAGSLSDRQDFIRWRTEGNIALIEAQYELCSAEARLSKAVGRPVNE